MFGWKQFFIRPNLNNEKTVEIIPKSLDGVDIKISDSLTRAAALQNRSLESFKQVYTEI